MNKLIAVFMSAILLSNPSIGELKEEALITNEKRMQLLVESYALDIHERSPYLIALSRQNNAKLFDRTCIIKVRASIRDSATVALKPAIVCQFLSWHNLRLLRGDFTEEQASRFSEAYFDGYAASLR